MNNLEIVFSKYFYDLCFSFSDLDTHAERDGERDEDEEVGEQGQEEGAAVRRVGGGYLKRKHHYDVRSTSTFCLAIFGNSFAINFYFVFQDQQPISETEAGPRWVSVPTEARKD